MNFYMSRGVICPIIDTMEQCASLIYIVVYTVIYFVAMYLGLPTLMVVKLKEAYTTSPKLVSSSTLAETYFRNWYNGRKRVG